MKAFFPYLALFKGVRLKLALAIGIGIVAGAFNFAFPFLLDRVLPRIFGSEPIPNAELVGYVVLIPVLFSVRTFGGFFNTYLTAACGIEVLEKLRVQVFSKLQDLHLGFFSGRNSGDLLSRVTADTAQLRTTLLAIANDLTVQPFMLIWAIGFLAFKAIQADEVAFLLLYLAIVPICVFPMRAFGKRLHKRAKELQAETGNITERIRENLTSSREVRAFNLQERERDRFGVTIRKLFRAQLKVVKYNKILSPTIELITACGISAAIYYAAKSSLTLEEITAIVVALHLAYEPVKKLGGVHNNLKKGRASLDRIEEVLDAPVLVMEPESPVDNVAFDREIAFRKVTFSYGAEPALRDVSFAAGHGQTVALVGPSGAGKSTVANLLLRFYDPEQGDITIGGIPLHAISLARLREHIALVSQDPVLFNDTLLNNIRLGRQDASDEEVIAAAAAANADGFIQSFDEGYATMVGERGARLSGGQRQRIAIARAFLRNAPILILDEATSALDAESEEAIQTALAKLVQGKTTFVIAHRFSTIRQADNILVLDGGRLIAQGPHETLMRDCPLYESLYSRQAGA